MASVTRFCHRAMLLERGRIVAIGDPREVADRYLEIAFGRSIGYEDPDIGSARMGDGSARVTELWLGDNREERRAVAPQSEPLTIKALVRFNAEVLDPAVTVTLLNEQRQPVLVATTAEDHERSGGFQADEWAVFGFSFHNMLAPGRYHTLVTISHRGEGLDVIDRLAGGLSFVVTGMVQSGGMVEIPVETEVARWGVWPGAELPTVEGAP
jgi:hypothetical protein